MEPGVSEQAESGEESNQAFSDEAGSQVSASEPEAVTEKEAIEEETEMGVEFEVKDTEVRTPDFEVNSNSGQLTDISDEEDISFVEKETVKILTTSGPLSKKSRTDDSDDEALLEVDIPVKEQSSEIEEEDLEPKSGFFKRKKKKKKDDLEDFDL